MCTPYKNWLNKRMWQLTISVTLVVILALFLISYSSSAKGIRVPRSQASMKRLVDPDSVTPDFNMLRYP